MREPTPRSRQAIPRLRKESQKFFRLGPADPGKAQCFAVRRGEIEKRIDCAYHEPSYRFALAKLEKGQFPVVPFGKIIVPETGIRYGTGTPPPVVEKGLNAVPFIRATDIKEGEIQEPDLLFIEKHQPSDMKKCLLSARELIIVRSGVNTGDCAVVPKRLEGSYAAYDLIIRLADEALPEYAAQFFDTLLGRAQLNVRKGRAAQPHLNAEEISTVLIPLPPLPVQREMVAQMARARESRRRKLAEADTLLSGLDAFLLDRLGLTVPDSDNRLAYATRLNQVANERFDPHFHHPNFRHLLAEIQRKPNKRLGDIASFSKEQHDPADLPGETFRYIEISGVNRYTGEITANETATSDAPSRARMLVREGDIIVSLTRPHHGSIAFIDEEFDNCIASTGFAVIHEYKDSSPLPHYLLAILRSSLSLQQMLQRSSGGNYPAITEEELKRILIPIPDEKTQRKTVDELRRRRMEARRLREEAAREWEAAKARFEARLLGRKRG